MNDEIKKSDLAKTIVANISKIRGENFDDILKQLREKYDMNEKELILLATKPATF